MLELSRRQGVQSQRFTLGIVIRDVIGDRVSGFDPDPCP